MTNTASCAAKAAASDDKDKAVFWLCQGAAGKEACETFRWTTKTFKNEPATITDGKTIPTSGKEEYTKFLTVKANSETELTYVKDKDATKTKDERKLPWNLKTTGWAGKTAQAIWGSKTDTTVTCDKKCQEDAKKAAEEAAKKAKENKTEPAKCDADCLKKAKEAAEKRAKELKALRKTPTSMGAQWIAAGTENDWGLIATKDMPTAIAAQQDNEAAKAKKQAGGSKSGAAGLVATFGAAAAVAALAF